MIDFAYSRLGLRFNPFGELDRQQRIENALPRCDLDSIRSYLQDNSCLQQRAVQFMGPRGSGKSTHLLLLAARLPDFHYVHLPVDSKRDVPVCTNLMIDEVQRAGRRQQTLLFRNAQRVVLGTHRDFSNRLEESGFEVQTIALDEQPQIDWLVKTLNRKIELAQRPMATKRAIPRIRHQTVVQLRQEFGSDIRGLEGRLYDVFQALNSGSPNGSPLQDAFELGIDHCGVSDLPRESWLP